MRPTLLSSCARAATAAEARFRIDYPEPATRSSRVIALDQAAAGLVRGLGGQRWFGGRFLSFDHLTAAGGVNGGANGTDAADAVLRDSAGAGTLLSAELDDADVAVMVATAAASGQAAQAAPVIGDACASRFIMSAALVVDEGDQAAVSGVVARLRPNAMVLVVLKDGDDIAEILRALRV